MSSFIMDGFQCISPATYLQLQKPLTAESDTDSGLGEFDLVEDPRLILLFPWTGANPRHIVKYVDGYKKLYPASSVLVITTSIKDIVIRSPKQKQQRLRPAVETILSQGLDKNILAHSFSEGGANKFIEMAEIFLKLTGRRLPISSLILDSCPGVVRPDMLSKAFSATLPKNTNRVIHFAGQSMGNIIRVAHETGLHTRIGDQVILRSRHRLSDPTLLDIHSASRSYLYSASDPVIHYEDIEAHSEEAKANGVKVVEMVRFEESGHCGHIREDEDKYWNAVQNTWNNKAASKL